jgi:hypothetical protein
MKWQALVFVLATAAFCLGFGAAAPEQSLREAAQGSGLLIGTAVRQLNFPNRHMHPRSPVSSTCWNRKTPSSGRWCIRSRSPSYPAASSVEKRGARQEPQRSL